MTVSDFRLEPGSDFDGGPRIECPMASCSWEHQMPSTLGDATAVAAQHLDDAHPVCRRIRLFMLNTGDCVSCELDEGHDGDCLCHGATGWWRFPQPTPKRGYTTGNVTAVDAADVPAEAASRVVGRIIYWSVPT